MRYLSKSAESPIIQNNWHYPRDAARIRAQLQKEQHGFCAYSERYIEQTDAVEVEHFDPRKKATVEDGYLNWYAVLRWMNQHKPRRIEPFLPLLSPDSASLTNRIVYRNGQFLPADPHDEEAQNLINYLGWQRPELVEHRNSHIRRLRFVRRSIGNDEQFHEYLVKHPVGLSFFSALRVELNLPDNLIEQIENSSS